MFSRRPYYTTYIVIALFMTPLHFIRMDLFMQNLDYFVVSLEAFGLFSHLSPYLNHKSILLFVRQSLRSSSLKMQASTVAR